MYEDWQYQDTPLAVVWPQIKNLINKSIVKYELRKREIILLTDKILWHYHDLIFIYKPKIKKG